MAALRLVEPSLEFLPGYLAAVETGWSPSASRDLSGAHAAAIREDRHAFLRHVLRREEGPATLPGGEPAPGLFRYIFWLWDGEFCGTANLRFVAGSPDLPSDVSGHVGYGVVPWKRNCGYATQTLAGLLRLAPKFGLTRVSVTCDVSNAASRRVIEKNGGVFAGEQEPPDRPGERKSLFWIDTTA